MDGRIERVEKVDPIDTERVLRMGFLRLTLTAMARKSDALTRTDHPMVPSWVLGTTMASTMAR